MLRVETGIGREGTTTRLEEKGVGMGVRREHLRVGVGIGVARSGDIAAHEGAISEDGKR